MSNDDVKPDVKPKQYGLITKSKTTFATRALKPAPNVFGDEESDEEQEPTQQQRYARVEVSSRSKADSKIKMLYEQALAEDPNIFDYDQAYDEMQQKKHAEEVAKKEADKERKPKYVEQLLKSARAREMEFIAREERKQQKERIAEGEQFADKEVFVTGAYKKKMEELEKFRKDQEYQDRLDELMDVRKQGGLSGFYRNLLDDLTSDNRNAKLQANVDQAEEAPPEPDIAPPRAFNKYKAPAQFEDDEENALTVDDMERPRKDRHRGERKLRRRDNCSDEESEEEKKQSPDRRRRRSSTGSDASFTGKNLDEPGRPMRNQRRPSSEASEGEEHPATEMPEKTKRRKERTREHRSHKDEHREEQSKAQQRDSRSRDKCENEDVKEVKDIKPKEDPVVQRRRTLRELLARRNTNEQIEQLAKAFFERQASGVIAANIPV